MTDKIPTSEEMLQAFQDNIVPVLTAVYEAYKKQEQQLASARAVLEQAALMGDDWEHSAVVQAAQQWLEKYNV